MLNWRSCNSAKVTSHCFATAASQNSSTSIVALLLHPRCLPAAPFSRSDENRQRSFSPTPRSLGTARPIPPFHRHLDGSSAAFGEGHLNRLSPTGRRGSTRQSACTRYLKMLFIAGAG